MLARTAAVVVAAVVLAGCGAFAQRDGGFARAPRATVAVAAADGFSVTPCPFPTGARDRVDCGVLTVLENRGDPESGTVQLAVAILRSPSPAPAPDPILFLHGGPGADALPAFDTWLRPPFPPLTDRDLVLLDQRGGGYSAPSLDCDEVDRVPDAVVALSQCRQRLHRAGVDLVAYDSATIAADVEDLRTALGYRRWNVLAVSFGTRVALAMLRSQPSGVRSVVLDSPYPPHVDAFAAQGANVAHAIDAVLAGCAADQACGAAFPTLRADFLASIARLDAAPEPVTTPLPGGADDKVLLDGNALVDAVFNALYVTPVIPDVPRALALIARGDAAAGWALLAPAQRLAGRSNPPADGSSEGAFWSAECREEVPFADPAAPGAALAAAPLGAELANWVLDDVAHAIAVCDAWSVPRADAATRQPVVSDVPVLVLSGEYDPVTPASWGERTAAFLPRATAVTLRGHGHAVSADGGCSLALIGAFFADPVAPLDRSCVDDLPPPAWSVDG